MFIVLTRFKYVRHIFYKYGEFKFLFDKENATNNNNNKTIFKYVRKKTFKNGKFRFLFLKDE